MSLTLDVLLLANSFVTTILLLATRIQDFNCNRNKKNVNKFIQTVFGRLTSLLGSGMTSSILRASSKHEKAPR